MQQHNRGIWRRALWLEEIADDLLSTIGAPEIDGLGLGSRGGDGEEREGEEDTSEASYHR
jgi:hypothetical protein